VEAVQAAFEDRCRRFEDTGTNCPYRRASIDDEIIWTVDRSMIKHLLGDKVEHVVEMSAEANECVYMLSADHLINVDSVAAGD